jgi:sulfopyruvate decarboxylase alpha subunit
MRRAKLDIALHNMSTDAIADRLGARQTGWRTIEETRVSEVDPAPPARDWPDAIFAALRAAEIRQIGYVPDSGHTRLIEHCRADPEMRAVGLTSEEEGIGLAAGAWLGGQKAALLMQSSGVGNCINMLSLAKSCRFPLILLVTMRGEWAEFNPWQVPMGTKTQAALELMDVLVYRVERAEEAGETVNAALDIAFNGGLVTAVLLSQRLIGAKRWVK